MGKIYHRDFNSPKDVSLGVPEEKFGKVVQLKLYFKDAGHKYDFTLLNPRKPEKYNTGDRIRVEWDNLSEELRIAEITRIVVHGNSLSTSISFQLYDDIEVHIRCKNIDGLP